MPKYVAALAGGTALAVVASLGLTTALHKNDVTVVIDGVPEQVSVREDTVAEVLELQGITVGEHDVLAPTAETRITDGMEIVVNYGRPLDLTVDGQQRKVWTTAQNVDQALTYLGLNEDDATISTSRSTPVGREGLTLEVTTAKDVQVTAYGTTSPVRIAGTVRDALLRAGVKPDEDDIIKPAIDTPLTDGMDISFVNVQVKQTEEVVEVPFEKKTVKSDELDKGATEVTTKGTKGKDRIYFHSTFHDGKLVERKQVNKRTELKPVTEVTTVGTRKKEKPAKDTSEKKSTSKQKSSTESSAASTTLTPAKGSTCKASYYWDPQPTASGERFNTWAMTAAHKTLPMHTRVKVTNLANGRTTVVRINDRGPYIAGRCLDLSTAAMRALGGESAGVINVAYEVVS